MLSHDLVSAQWLGYFGWDLPCSSMGELVERFWHSKVSGFESRSPFSSFFSQL